MVQKETMLGLFLRGKRGKVSRGEPVSVITVSSESPGLDHHVTILYSLPNAKPHYANKNNLSTEVL